MPRYFHETLLWGRCLYCLKWHLLKYLCAAVKQFHNPLVQQIHLCDKGKTASFSYLSKNSHCFLIAFEHSISPKSPCIHTSDIHSSIFNPFPLHLNSQTIYRESQFLWNPRLKEQIKQYQVYTFINIIILSRIMNLLGHRKKEKIV